MLHPRSPVLLTAALLSSTILAGLPRAAAAQGSPASSEVLVLPTVNVTALKRDELAQDAPVAITVIPGDEIGRGGVDTLEDSAFRSLNTVHNAQGGPLAIRGIGSMGISGGVDRQPGVGVFLDDVYIARPFGYPEYLDDIERVEIVRGSQATLYGKNTIGGAVNLILRDPGDRLAGELGATYGTGPFGRVRGAFDAPLGDTGFGLRGYASWTGREGYIRNDYNGRQVSDTGNFATRYVFAGPLGNATDLRVAVDYSRSRDDGGLWFAPLDQAFRHRAAYDYAPYNRLDIGGVSARIDHRFATAKLTSITAIRGHELDTALDGDLTDYPMLVQAQREWQRQFSQDLRLSSDHEGPFRWTGGLFYMRENFHATQYYDYLNVPKSQWSRSSFHQNTDTYSTFGEVGYRVLPPLEIVGGLRYTYENKNTDAGISSPSGTYVFGFPANSSGSASFYNLSPEFSLNYIFRPGNLTYARLSRGFKSGGISPFVETGDLANRYDPETTTTYEIGAKTTWLDGRLALNAALFHTDWQDQQAVIYTSPVTRVIRNAGESTSRGAEVEATYRMTRNLTINAGYAYLDAQYDDFRDRVLGQDYSGNALPFAPRHSTTLGTRWRQAVGDGVFLVAGANYAYRSQYVFDAGGTYRQPETHLVDARLGLEAPGWDLSIWGRNLLDERYLRQYYSTRGGGLGTAALGRTVGITLTSRW